MLDASLSATNSHTCKRSAAGKRKHRREGTRAVSIVVGWHIKFWARSAAVTRAPFSRAECAEQMRECVCDVASGVDVAAWWAERARYCECQEHTKEEGHAGGPVGPDSRRVWASRRQRGTKG